MESFYSSFMDWPYLSFASSSLLFGFIFGLLYYVYRNRYLKLWSASYTVIASAYLFLYIVSAFNYSVFIPIYLFTIASGSYLFYRASLDYMQFQEKPIWKILLGLATVLTAGMVYSEYLLIYGWVVLSILSGLFYLSSGILFVRSKDNINRLVGSMILILSLMIFVSPTVINFLWSLPWFYLINGMLGLIVTLGILGLHFRSLNQVLRKSQQELKTITENMTDVVSMADTEGRFTYLSESIYQQIGYKPSELLGKSILELIHEGDLSAVGAIFQEGVVEGRKDARVEYRVRHKNGDYIWVETIGSLVLDDKGQPSGALFTSRDISDRKQAEQKLQFQAEILDSIGNLVTATAPDGTILYVNEAECKKFGKTREELIGKTTDIYGEDPGYGALQKEIVEATNEMGFWRGEVVNYDKDNNPIYLDCRTWGMRDADGVVHTLIGVASDITDRKKAEEALRVSEEKYRQIAENISDVLWITDAQLNTVYISPSVEKLIGESVDYQMNRSLEERFPPDSLNKILQTFQEEMEKEKDPLVEKNRSSVVEVQHYKADGSLIWISMHILATRDEDGNITGFQGVTRDITERKKAEEDLRLQASERAAVDTFTYSVSNDLQAPLRRIEGFSEAMLDECSDHLNDQARDYLNRIVAQIGSMRKLTDALLQLSKVVSRDIDRETVDLSALVRSNLEKMHHEEPDRRVESVVAPELIVEGDTELLNLMLANLLDNAWKFTSKRAEACIEFGRKEQSGRTVYYLKDNGIGFDMKHAEKLFTPFQKLHNENEYPGKGIGLNLAYRIISRHKGEIWAEGEVDKGACFCFTLP